MLSSNNSLLQDPLIDVCLPVCVKLLSPEMTRLETHRGSTRQKEGKCY